MKKKKKIHFPIKIGKNSLVNEIFSDQYFIAPAAREALLYARKNCTVYAYVFEHENTQLLSSASGTGVKRGKFYAVNIPYAMFWKWKH